MNSLQLTRGQGRYKRSFKKRVNQRAAKERKRLTHVELPDEPEYIAPKLPKPKTATVSIRCGSEAITFQVFRFDEKRLVCRGRAQAASTIGKRIALILDSQL